MILQIFLHFDHLFAKTVFSDHFYLGSTERLHFSRAQDAGLEQKRCIPGNRDIILDPVKSLCFVSARLSTLYKRPQL
jgi:hypothetical protein